MANWANMTGGSTDEDFLSLYMSRTHTPSHQCNGDESELQFSPSPTKPSVTSVNGTADDVTFCTRDNVDDCVAYLNQEVTVVGMPSLYDGPTGTFDIVRLVNCTHELLQKHQKSRRLREDLENRLHRNESDHDHLQMTHSRLKTTLEQCRRDLAQAQEKERQQVHKNKLLNARLKEQKEEVRRLQSVMQNRDSQYKHELKKKERETNKLKERLNTLMSSQNKARKVGMEISHSLQKAAGKRGTWRNDSQKEEEMYRLVISDYEQKQKELMVENTELRESLNKLQKEIVALFNEPSPNSELNGSQNQRDLSDLTDTDDDVSVASSQTNQSLEEISEGHFQMPYGIVRDGIEKFIKEKCKLLKQYLKEIRKHTDPNSLNVKEKYWNGRHSNRGSEEKLNRSADEKMKKEIEKLNRENEKYKHIIEQQEHFIQENLEAQNDLGEDASILRDSYLWDDWEMVQRDKRIIQQQRQQLNEEKRSITHARKQMEKERRAFEVEKGTTLQDQFMNLSPFANDSHKGTHKNKPRRQRMLPTTPSSAPASHVHITVEGSSPPPTMGTTSTPVNAISTAKVTLPTTNELYRALGITTDQGFFSGHDDDVYSSPPLKNPSERDPSPIISVPSSSHTSPNTSLHSPVPSARINQHVENIKMTLFHQQHGAGDAD